MVELSRYMEEASRVTRPPGRAKKAPAAPETTYCLPPGCQGGGYQLRARMEALAQECGNNDRCLRAGLEKIWQDLKEGKPPWATQNG